MPCHEVTGGTVYTVYFNWPIKVYDAACESKSVNDSNLLLMNVLDHDKQLVNVESIV